MEAFPHEVAPVFAPMGPKDVKAVMSIEVVSFPTPWSEGTYRHELHVRHASYWVIRPTLTPRGVPEPPRVLAYAGLWHLGEESHVTTIATHPNWRRRHLGEWLLLQLAGVARERGSRALTLEVRVSNAPAIALYTKLGFVPSGLRKGYYLDTGEDAHLLSLFAIDHPAVWAKLQAMAAEIEATGAPPAAD
jgi:ribosomal-protein-alanine N-acetyltransferase